MKRIFPILMLLAMAFSASAQVPPYKYGVAAEDSKSRVAQLNFYPYEANEAVWLLYAISNSGTNIFLQPGATNNLVVGPGATINQTNILVMPNPTNSVGATFNIVSGQVATILSNSVGGGFNNMTNFPNGGVAPTSVYQLNTNRAVKVFSPNGTNWFVLETKM